MARGADARTGGCLCGAVRFTATPRQPHFGACHCAMCRRWAGGVWMAVGCGPDVSFNDSAPVATFSSSKWAERGFCAKCGTALFYRLRDSGHYQMALGAFDDSSGLTFTRQIFIDEKPDSYAFADDTRNLTGAEVIDGYLADKSAGAIAGTDEEARR